MPQPNGQPTEAVRRPPGVWVVASCLGFGVVGSLGTLVTVLYGLMPLTAGLSLVDVFVGVLTSLLNLAGIIQLVRLRRSAFYLFCTALGLSLVVAAWHVMTKGWLASFPPPSQYGFVLGSGLAAVVCLYSKRLLDRGILRGPVKPSAHSPAL